MLTLAFDTSTSFGSVALFENQNILFEKSWLREQSHSEMLTSAIDLALRTSHRQVNDVKRLCVGIGPGSFTGIRVSVNVARSLAFALDIPVVCLDSFDILVLGCDPAQTEQKNLIGMIDAYNNEIFCARFEKINSHWKRDSPSQSKTLAQMENEIQTSTLCLGEAYNQYEVYFSTRLQNLVIRDSKFNQFPNVKNLVQSSGWTDLLTQPLAWNEVQALYIKASAAEEKLKETK